MKKIVKNGKIERHETYPLFICPVCNCEFYGEEMPQDYEKITYYKEDLSINPYCIKKYKYISTCPCCSYSKVEHDGSKFFTTTISIEGEEEIKKFLKEPQKGQFSCLK